MPNSLVDVTIQYFPKNVVDKRTLSRTTDTGHTDEFSERKFSGDITQVMMRCAVDLDGVPVSWSTNFWDLNCSSTAEKCARQTAFRILYFVDGPFGNHFSAAHSWPRTKIDQMFSGLHRFIIVFNDDNGISLITQIFKTVEQHRVIARVKTD